MNNTQIVFFNIAWMDKYQGPATATHGGGYVTKHGFGCEAFNFQHFGGKMYGFVKVGGGPQMGIRILKLGSQRAAHSVSGILVIWTARHPASAETRVVGWYEDAVIYRHRQAAPPGSHRRLPNGQDAPYHTTAQKMNCLLIPPHKRDLRILRAAELRAAGRQSDGGIGQSNIWYAHDAYGGGVKQTVLDYIAQWNTRKHLSVPL